ncbi:MAG: hypothetical protein J6P97_04910 [Bacteroidales bacterium]|nr:hypothetical protein [Bacteroidales bacterium]
MKYIIINKKNELYNVEKDCFVQEFEKDCLCEKETANKYFTNYGYKIYAVTDSCSNFRIVKIDEGELK